MTTKHDENYDEKYPSDLSVLRRNKWERNSNFFLGLLYCKDVTH